MNFFRRLFGPKPEPLPELPPPAREVTPKTIRHELFDEWAARLEREGRSRGDPRLLKRAASIRAGRR